jgi:hypothetical protein
MRRTQIVSVRRIASGGLGRATTALGALGVAASVLLPPLTGRADWPMPRHDPRRSAAASGLGDITAPVPYWRFYAGGTIGGAQALSSDVDGDGQAELVLCTGRKLFAKRPSDDTLLWEAAGTDCAEIIAPIDLDGDGVEELLVTSKSQVRVVRLSDGAVLWTEPAGEMGTVWAVRAADLDGDGRPEVTIQDCGTCAVASGKTGFAYKFSGAGASLASPVLLWTIPEGINLAATPAALARLRSADRADLVESTMTELVVIDGQTGALAGKTAALGAQMYANVCQPVNVDDTPTEELLCLQSAATTTAGEGRRLMLFRFAQGSLGVDWTAKVGDKDGAAGRAARMVADLDGDGSQEVVVFGKTATDAWASYVYDAGSGALLAELEGNTAVATAAILSGGQSAVITNEGEALRAWRFARDGKPTLAPIWTLADRTIVGEPDLARGLRTYDRLRPVTYDGDGDGIDELVVVAARERNRLELVRGPSASGDLAGSFDAPGGTTILTAWRFDTSAEPRLGVALSDGNLLLLDEALEPVSGQPGFGARFAGFFSPDQWRELLRTPVTASLGGGPPGLLVPTSRDAVVRVDAMGATFAVGPQILWSRAQAMNPVIAAGLDGGASPGIFVVEPGPASQRVVALGADGGELWASAPLDGGMLADLVPGSFDGDAVPDVLVQWAKPGQAMELDRTLAGVSGEPLWEVGFFQTNLTPSGAAAADWNGDGVDDVVLQQAATRVLAGQSGTQLAVGASDWPYSMPTLHDLDGNGSLEVSLHGRQTGARALSHDLGTVLWAAADDERPFSYAAVVECPGSAPEIVSGSWGFPARLTFRVGAGPSGGQATAIVLAGGARFGDEIGATSAGATLAQLASPVVHDNLAGDGQPKILVGSADGWLYGLDACARTLAFTHFFGAPVGSVIFGDTDADGLDEILVSVADGFVYALEEPPIAAVTVVRDVDPTSADPHADVDVIVTDDTLHAAWDAVPGADGYEIAFVADAVDGGGFVTKEPWISVAEPRASVAGLPLVLGRRYFASVRALKGGRPSPDTLSDGVRVVEALPPSGAGGGGSQQPIVVVFLVGRSCVHSCAVAPTSGGDLGWLALVALASVLRRAGRSGSREPGV